LLEGKGEEIIEVSLVGREDGSLVGREDGSLVGEVVGIDEGSFIEEGEGMNEEGWIDELYEGKLFCRNVGSSDGRCDCLLDGGDDN